MSDYTPDDIAAEMRVSRRWVIEHLPQLPHYRVGNQIRFTPDDLTRIKSLGRDKAAPADASGLTSRSRRSA